MTWRKYQSTLDLAIVMLGRMTELLDAAHAGDADRAIESAAELREMASALLKDFGIGVSAVTPAEMIRSEPVVFDAVEEGDWVVPAWPSQPEWPPMRVQEIDRVERVLVVETALAFTIGPSAAHVHIVTEETWNQRGASRYQWLRLPGLREAFAALAARASEGKVQ